MKALGNGNFACGIFVVLQKAFDAVDHSTLLSSKLCHYGLAYKWFESYLADRKKFIAVNCFALSVSSITGVSQGSVLPPFLLYINDLHVAIKNCKAHHFPDETNLIIINKSLKRLKKLLNIGLEYLANWLNANKISLNISKTESIIFKPKGKLPSRF